ncbi:hypothetical protein A374_08694 [Fictibacillus macauensis ZFHKF-1]|uniref:Uncharacterized protein n=1 Tax=Fictibacillus macauensis ZFHKF-1 TaxID=1196324 RepID=I8UG71_9BACL|nr:hypothetical protein [Fictibacillus macauensis]EIT85900.1 hypothetical protein A374_08694 [Fictibacillus macauensis ZFHKF-1]
MALSGSLYTNVGSHWRLSLSWSATQDEDANKSTITAKLYWEALDGYGAISSGSRGESAIQINDGAWSTDTASPSLSGNQKKLIHTYTKTLTHDSEGKCSFSIDGYFEPKVTLSGKYYGSVNLDQETFRLNTIPRESKVSGGIRWVAGEDYSLSIAAASSSFKHRAKFYIRKNSSDSWLLIKTVEGIGTSKLVKFSEDEHIKVFNRMQGYRGDGEVKIVLTTYSGSDTVGSDTEKTGLLYVNGRQTMSDIPSLTVGETVSLYLTNLTEFYVTNIAVYVADKLITTFRNIGYQATLDSAKYKDAILNAMGASNASAEIRYELTSYYLNDSNAYLLDGPLIKYAKIYAPSDPPVFTGILNHYDSNSSSVLITGSSQQLIQGLSQLTVSIPSSQLAQAQNGATIAKYTASFGSLSRDFTPNGSGDIVINLGTVPMGGQGTLKVTAIDSRGQSTTLNKSVNVIPYTPPVIMATSTRRINGFGETGVLSFNAAYNPVVINGVPKNTIIKVAYRWRNAMASSADIPPWSPETLMTFVTNEASVQTNVANLDGLASDKAYEIQFVIKDNISKTDITKIATIQAGKPLVDLNPDLNSVGIGKFATKKNALQIDGEVEAKKVTSESIDLLGGTLRAVNNNLLLNNKPLFQSGVEVLWDGTNTMTAAQTITPKKKITDCPNGWVLVWTDKDGWYDVTYTFIPKLHVLSSNTNGVGVYSVAPATNTATGIAQKYVYIDETTVRGNDNNEATVDKKAVILRQVWAY